MRKLSFMMAMFILMILISGLAQAQAQSRTKSGNQPDDDRELVIYAIAGLGHIGGTNRFEAGGGIETYVFKGLSIGGEVDYNGGAAGAGGFAALSPTASYHLLNGVRVKGSLAKFDPFLTGGYSRLTGSGLGVNTFVIGGGANYWLAEKWGLRFDLRDHVAGSGSLFGLRGGVVFAP